MFPGIPTEQITATIEQAAEQAVWQAAFDAPPIDAFTIAHNRGMVVAEDGYGGPRARRVVMSDGGQSSGDEVILLAPEERPERRHWAVAHEIGESLAWRVFDELGVHPVDASLNAREWIANRLACAVLLPRCWFVEALAESDTDLFELKRRFSTASHELIARRWLETIGDPILVTLFDQGEVTWRRNNFGPGRPAFLPEERAAWRRSHETNRPTEHEPRYGDQGGGLSRVRCWPVHEPGWRREIMLSEIAAPDATDHG